MCEIVRKALRKNT